MQGLNLAAPPLQQAVYSVMYQMYEPMYIICQRPKQLRAAHHGRKAIKGTYVACYPRRPCMFKPIQAHTFNSVL